MNEVVDGDLRAVPTTGGFYEVTIGGTSAVLGTISPVTGFWYAAYALPETSRPALLGLSSSIEDALALFSATA